VDYSHIDQALLQILRGYITDIERTSSFAHIHFTNISFQNFDQAF